MDEEAFNILIGHAATPHPDPAIEGIRRRFVELADTRHFAGTPSSAESAEAISLRYFCAHLLWDSHAGDAVPIALVHQHFTSLNPETAADPSWTLDHFSRHLAAYLHQYGKPGVPFDGTAFCKVVVALSPDRARFTRNLERFQRVRMEGIQQRPESVLPKRNREKLKEDHHGPER